MYSLFSSIYTTIIPQNNTKCKLNNDSNMKHTSTLHTRCNPAGVIFHIQKRIIAHISDIGTDLQNCDPTNQYLFLLSFSLFLFCLFFQLHYMLIKYLLAEALFTNSTTQASKIIMQQSVREQCYLLKSKKPKTNLSSTF